MTNLNPTINKVVLENAPQNVKYIIPIFQKETFHIIADRVLQMIREEVGDE